MAFEFRLPDIGEGVVEGEIVAWHRNEGDQVHEDDPLVEVMTDKATVTIPSPKTGVVTRTCYAVGEVAPVGELLVVIEPEGATAGSNGSSTGAGKTAAEPKQRPQAAAPAAPSNGGATPRKRRSLATPATRKLARDLGVDIQGLAGTGDAGRITKEDIMAASGQTPVAAVMPSAAPMASVPPPAPVQPVAAVRTPPPAPIAPASTAAAEERVPIRGLRKRIFERMAASKHTAAHFTYVEEVDMTRLVDTRQRLRERAEKQGARLTYLPFFMKAVALGLRDFPHLNGRMDDERNELVVSNICNLSIAVATEAGLTAPVVPDVGGQTIYELCRVLEDLSVRARDGQLTLAELSGGTFTITSLGAQGGMFATPIINYPEVAILGIHKIEDRPVVIDGEVVVRKRMYLSASFDHRVIDGHVGAAFVQRVKELIEDPDALLLELR